jgi:hydroxymethylglutaryl-CoA lyase
VDDLVLADTVGYGNSAQVRTMIRALRAEVGGKLRGLHLHERWAWGSPTR